MGHILKKIVLDNGQEYCEKSCGNYICKYCGGKATSTNYILGICVQVHAKHIGYCGSYQNSDEYVGYITECSTCAYFEDECTYMGKDKL